MEKIKVDIISGFLGAGKTTVIREMLKKLAGKNVAIIENEYGEIAIDGDLLSDKGTEIYELANGCICCLVADDFVNILKKIAEEKKFNHLILEPTGISMLSEIRRVFDEDGIKEYFQIEKVMTVVDATLYLEQKEAYGEFFTDQIKNGELIYLSKVQDVNKETIDKIERSIKEIHPKGNITEDIFAPGGFPKIRDISFSKKHGTDFNTYSLVTKRSYPLGELEGILKEIVAGGAGEIVRGKGIVSTPLGGYSFQIVENSYQLEAYRKLVDENKMTLIGKNIDIEMLENLWKDHSK